MWNLATYPISWESCPPVPSFWGSPPVMGTPWLLPAQPAMPTSSSPDIPSCLALAGPLAARVPLLFSLISPLGCNSLLQPKEAFTLPPKPPETTLVVPQGEVWTKFVEAGYLSTSLHHQPLCFPCPSSPRCTEKLPS